MTLRHGLAAALLAGCLAIAAGTARAETNLQFYYPIAVGGPIPKLIDGMVADFEKDHPDIKVKPVYAGSYQDTIAKVLTAVKGGDAPQLAVLLSTDMYTLIDEDAVVPFDSIGTTLADKAWLDSFYPAFMENSRTGGKTWGVPFQRSTVVMFWNKEAFKDAGLNPDQPPKTWDELAAFGQKLTKRDAAGNVTQWGVEIPSSGFPYWLFQGLTTENDVRLMNAAGTQTSFDDPKVVEALQYWVDLSHKWKVQPPGIIEWGTTPQDFFERKTAIMWTTTGNLTNVRNNAKFPFGVAMLPAKGRPGTPTGGGNFYVFKKSSPAEQAAALTFIKWMTSPERAAQWGIGTGYVAVSPAAWETPTMQAYLKDFPPAGVARDQLKFAVAELSTHDNQRVTKALNDGLQAALTGSKTPEQAMKAAQAEAERILKPYR
ncbi:MAG TPA: ABC transporter substrate-binding protein [Alphaproteobacteria bacterium]|nr:ABC transporter substrate-binding protein [Alphaproteobacteria bacterium]